MLFRSCGDIKDIKADDIRGYRECHFFNGVGAWSYALRIAGYATHSFNDDFTALTTTIYDYQGNVLHTVTTQKGGSGTSSSSSGGVTEGIETRAGRGSCLPMWVSISSMTSSAIDRPGR